MLPKLIGIVKQNLSGAKRRKDGRGEDGVWGKGQQSLAPPQHTVTARSAYRSPDLMLKLADPHRRNRAFAFEGPEH